MKVAQLIRELQTADPENEVILWADDKGYEVGTIYDGEEGFEIQAGKQVEAL